MPQHTLKYRPHIEDFNYDHTQSGKRATYHMQVAIRKGPYGADLQVSHRTTLGPTVAIMETLSGVVFGNPKSELKPLRGSVNTDTGQVFLTRSDNRDIVSSIPLIEVSSYIVDVRIVYHSLTKTTKERRITRNIHGNEDE